MSVHSLDEKLAYFAEKNTGHSSREAETLLNTIYNEVGGLDSNTTSQLFHEQRENNWNTEKLEELMDLAIRNRMLKTAIGYAFLISVAEEKSSLETRAEELTRLQYVSTSISKEIKINPDAHTQPEIPDQILTINNQISSFFSEHPTQRGDRDVLYFRDEMTVGDF